MFQVSRVGKYAILYQSRKNRKQSAGQNSSSRQLYRKQDYHLETERSLYYPTWHAQIIKSRQGGGILSVTPVSWGLWLDSLLPLQSVHSGSLSLLPSVQRTTARELFCRQQQLQPKAGSKKSELKGIPKRAAPIYILLSPQGTTTLSPMPWHHPLKVSRTAAHQPVGIILAVGLD